MPGLDITGTSSQGGDSNPVIGGNGDVSSGSSEGEGGTVVINPGSGPAIGSYVYDIVTASAGYGNAYLSSSTSSMIVDSSVGVFNRNNCFSTHSSSSLYANNCCAYIASRGFQSYGASDIQAQNCVSVLCYVNYNALAGSNINLLRSASVFPTSYGCKASSKSNIMLTDYETMTVPWANYYSNFSFEYIPHHFSSNRNSYIANRSSAFTGKLINVQGLSAGAYLVSGVLNYVWSGIQNDPPLAVSGVTASIGDGGTLKASYRYVPLSHSTDYTNVIVGLQTSSIGNMVTPTSEIRSNLLMGLLKGGRQCYDDVKPYFWLYQPEDRSGGLTGSGLTGSFNLFATFTENYT